jgi:LacI family transcriptional regulator
MSITTKQIAELAKVSQSTVSRCLNNSPLVSERTKRKVLKIAREHGFQFNANARSLSTNKTNTIGFVFSQIYTKYGVDINFKSWLDEIMKNLEDRGYDVIISSFRSKTAKQYQNSIKKFITAKKVDGLVIMTPELDEETVEFLEKTNTPYVLSVFRPDSFASKEVDYIYVDQFKGGYLAAEHLIKLGHRKILSISADIEGDVFPLRTAGMKAAFRDYGIEFDEKLLIYGDTTFKSGKRVIQENFDLLNGVTAIFAQNDMMALGAISALQQRGIEVPRDMAVVGFDDIELCELFRPYLTSIQQPAPELASLTCERLVAQLKSKKGGTRQPVAIEPRLIVRESCGSAIV